MRINSKVIPQHILDKMRPEDLAEIKEKTSTERLKASGEKSEDEIQKEVEKYLQFLGYEKRTPSPKCITQTKPRSGWYMHHQRTKTKGAPIMLDLLILSNDGVYLELELKAERGNIKPHQQMLVDQGASLARSVKEAVDIAKEWHYLARIKT